MRTLKFRAWDDVLKYYINPNELVYRLDGYLFSREFQEELHDAIIEQFTGLQDKNGKDIYEGDIVKGKQWNPDTYQVGFNRGGFCFFNEGDKYYEDCKYLNQFEIIGNVHENKHLLKSA